MKRFLGAALLLGACATTLYADEGRIPIYQQTTISQPGYYLVTRDFTAPAGSHGIVVQASNVVVDLNGHTVTTTDAFRNGVEISDGSSNITIRNGRLTGGLAGVHYYSFTTPSRIFVDSVDITNTSADGISFQGVLLLDVRNSNLHATHGIVGFGTAGGEGVVRIVNTTIKQTDGPAIWATVMKTVELRNNVISETTSGWAGIVVSGSTAYASLPSVIEGNTVTLCNRGIDVQGTNMTVLIKNNVIINNREVGIALATDDNTVVGNNISRNASHGVTIQGNRNLIDANQIDANGVAGTVYGIYFQNNNAIYRNNILRGNRTAATGGTNGNTNGGGNIS